MVFESQSAKGDTGTWVARNGAMIGFGPTLQDAEHAVLRGRSIYFTPDEWRALTELIKQGRGF